MRAAFIAGYVVVLLVPLALISGVMKAGAQGRLVVFADALGFAALSLLALQIVVSGRWALTTKSFGLRSVLALHRQAGKAVLVLVVVHVVVLVIDDPMRLALFDLRTDPSRARAGILALLAVLVLAGNSVWRRRLRLSYERWRALHLTCTALVIAAAFAHVVWVDAYTSVPAVRWSVLALVLAAATALFWTRVARPYATALRAAHCLYGMDDHPFSLSSSAQRPERPSFTVKALGDFSGSLPELPIGSEVLLDGPHGEAAHDPPAVRGRLLVVAGIGVTPALSVIRTAAERGDRRPLLLFYGSRRWADVTFRDELGALQRELPNLRVVHVLSRPEPAWHGERGRIGEAILRRCAPSDLAGWAALICGPPAMVAEATVALHRLGMPPAAIQAEGFK